MTLIDATECLVVVVSNLLLVVMCDHNTHTCDWSICVCNQNRECIWVFFCETEAQHLQEETGSIWQGDWSPKSRYYQQPKGIFCPSLLQLLVLQNLGGFSSCMLLVFFIGVEIWVWNLCRSFLLGLKVFPCLKSLCVCCADHIDWEAIAKAWGQTCREWDILRFLFWCRNGKILWQPFFLIACLVTICLSYDSYSHCNHGTWVYAKTKIGNFQYWVVIHFLPTFKDAIFRQFFHD